MAESKNGGKLLRVLTGLWILTSWTTTTPCSWKNVRWKHSEWS